MEVTARLEQPASDECGKQSTLPEESKRATISGGNYLKGWMLVPHVRGALVPNISGSMGTGLRATRPAGRYKAPQRKRPCRSRALLVDPSAFASVRSSVVNRW